LVKIRLIYLSKLNRNWIYSIYGYDTWELSDYSQLITYFLTKVVEGVFHNFYANNKLLENHIDGGTEAKICIRIY